MFILLVSIKREIFTHICLALSLIVLRHIFSSMKFFQLCLSMHLTLFLPRQLETMTNAFTNILQQMYVDENRANWNTEIYLKIFIDIYKIWRYLNSILAFYSKINFIYTILSVIYKIWRYLNSILAFSGFVF